MRKLCAICSVLLLFILCATLMPTETHAATESDLTFSLNADNESYYVSGCNQYAEGELVIPATYMGKPVTGIGDYAFANCNGLTSVTISEGITYIGYEAFACCNYLANINLPDGLLYIDMYAFNGCPISSIYIPASVERIGGQAFWLCNKLKHIWVDPNNTVYASSDEGVVFNKDMTKLIQLPTGYEGTYTIPECVTSFGSALAYCPYLTEVIIPDGITSMSEAAFFDSGVKRIVLPYGMTSIPRRTFEGCSSLASIVIPNTVTYIGDRAFWNCSSLSEVVFCGTPEEYESLTRYINSMTGNYDLLRGKVSYHQWNTVLTEPTYTSVGQRNSTCAYCGAEETETIPAKFYGTSINLGNTLDMYFGFYTGLVDEGGKVVFVREFADGRTETTEAPITAFKKNNSVYDITYTGLAAKEMCDTIHITVYNGAGEIVGEHSDSIRSYLLRQLREKDYGQEFRTLCVDLLNYGAAAQETFGYNATDLANKDLTKDELAEGTQTVAAYTDKQTIDGNATSYYGTAYILETKISMAMAVRSSYFGDGCYALVSYTDHTGTEKNNIRLEGKKNNSVYEFFLNEIVAADGRCLLTIEFYKANGTKVVTVQDSMESYAARKADTYPLAVKMLAYSDSAYNYLHKNDK